MTLLTAFLSAPGADALAWTLVHFVWQGTLLALGAAVVMHWITTSASARYVAGVVTLGMMLAAPVVTFVVLGGAPMKPAATGAPIAAITAVDPAAVGPLSASDVGRTNATPVVLPALLAIWLAGVSLLSLRLLGGWILAQRLATSAVQPAAARIQQLARSVSHRLGLHRLVQVLESSAVGVPVVVGWLKPVVLLPSAALSGLTPGQVEALLAHELAHVRRHDYLVNVLQSIVETLLFYHPAVWWVSRRIREEREHCCDDLAVTVCDRLVYVHALADLATMTAHARLALAATDGSLAARVRRLLAGEATGRPGGGWISMGLTLLVVAGVGSTVIAISGRDQRETQRLDAPDASMLAGLARLSDLAASPALDRLEGLVPESGPVSPLPRLEFAERRGELPMALTQDARGDATLAPLHALDALTPRLPPPSTVAETDEVVSPQEIYRIGGDITEPTLMTRVEPNYPTLAKTARMQGPVYVEATIGRDGRVRNARAVSGAPFPLLRQAAVEAVQQWIYSPSKLNGTPIDVWLSVQVNFKLNESAPVTLQRLLEEAKAQYSPDLPDVRRLEEQVTASEGQVTTVPTVPGPVPLRDPTATVQAGDVLDIRIAGEGGLPRRYLVESGGTIRFPLLGPVYVVDLTIAQVRELVRSIVAERKLEGGSVTVELYRLK